MLVIRMIVAGLLVVLLASACAPASMEPKGRIHCPACHIELDALFEKKY